MTLDHEEDWLRVAQLMAGALVTALMLALACASAAATFVMYFWGGARLAATVGVTGFLVLAGALLAWRVARALRDKPPFLAAFTFAEWDQRKR
jgi:uncharacterized membrane protein YqjE